MKRQEQSQGVLQELCDALQPLLGRTLTATILSEDGSSVARFEGVFRCAYEPTDYDRLIIVIGEGTIRVRPRRVVRIGRWTVGFGGAEYATIGIDMADGVCVLIQEDLSHVFG